MRLLIHLLSLLLVLPSVGLAVAFLILENAISTKSLLGILGVLLDVFVWLFPSGLLACGVVLIALVVGGLTNNLRWLASTCVAVLAIGSSLVALTLISAHNNFTPEQLTFFVPALLSASLSIWLAMREWPRSCQHSAGRKTRKTHC